MTPRFTIERFGIRARTSVSKRSARSIPFPKGERVAKDQQPNLVRVPPGRRSADTFGVGRDAPELAVGVLAHEVQVRQRRPAEVRIRPEQLALLGDDGGDSPPSSFQSSQTDR